MNQSNNNSSADHTLPDEQHILNMQGFLRTIDFVPTAKPTRFVDQMFMVTAGGSSRLYIYDINPGTLGWKYTTLT